MDLPGSPHSEMRPYSPIQKRNILSSNKELLTDLRSVIQSYLDHNSLRSVASLSRLSGVPDSTIRRLMQEESIPDLATVIALLGVIYSLEERRVFLSKHFPQPYEVFDTAFDGSDQNYHELSYYLSSEVSQCILQLCANRQDITQESIGKTYGEYGLAKLEELMAAGHVVPHAEHNTLRLAQGGLENDVDLCLSNISLWSKVFDKNLMGTDGSLLASFSQGLSLEGLALAKFEGQEYIKKLSKIIRENPGNIPVSVGLIQNVFDSETFQEERHKRLGKVARPSS